MSKAKGKSKPVPPRTYVVELDRKHALEPLAAISETGLRARIFAAIRALATDPRPTGCKKLVGTRGTFWRLRVADWRIVYTVDDRRLYVLVVRAGDRKDVYRLLADLLK